MSAFSLEGRVALVTGASRGIGAGLAMALAQAGADIVLAARTQATLDETAARIAERSGRDVLAVAADVTDPVDVERMTRAAIEQFGQIDVLVNNVGGPVFNATFLDTRAEGWRRLIDLNLSSVVTCCRIVGEHMVNRERGSVINVGSATATRPWPAIAAYSVAKAGVLNLTQVLAQEWGEAGVRVNMMSPGWLRSEVNRALVESPRAEEQIRQEIPLGRWGEVEDLAGTAVWLASDASAYVTGAHIAVDGGLTAAVPERWRELRLERDWRGR